MPVLLAGGVAPILLHSSESLQLSMTLGGSAKVVEYDAGGAFLASTSYALSPTVIGPYPSTKILQIVAVNGIVTYNIIFRDASLQESRVLSQSGVASVSGNTTSEVALATITIPAGVLGSNGSVRITSVWSFTNNVNAKTLRIRLGGLAGTVLWTAAGASFASFKGHFKMFNRGSLSSQVAGDSAFGGSTNAVSTATIDTSVNQDLVVTIQKATGTDTGTLEAYLAELNPWFT